jgi:hypothetical protein
MLLMGTGQLAPFYFLTLHMQSIRDYAPMLNALVTLLPAQLVAGVGLGIGFVGAAAFCLAAVLAAVILLRPPSPGRNSSRRPVTSSTREPS